MQTRFTASSPLIRRMRTDNSYRLELDLAESQYDLFAILASPQMQGVELLITVETSSEAEL